jgi:RHS repeat-associated protein
MKIALAVSDPASTLAQTMTRVFDGLSRVKEMRGATGQLTPYTYDPQGNLKTALTHAIANDYDALNRLVKVTEPQLTGAPAAGTIVYAYDPQDNLKAVTDQRGLATTYGYSGFDELKTLTSPDTGVTQYTYDPAGNVKTMQDARGASATYGYDALNRLKTLLYTDESLTFTYANDYDALNRLVRVTEPQLTGAPVSGTVAYSYDAQDNLIAVTDQRGLATTYGYSGFDELKTLTSPDTGVTQYTYDPAGNVKTMQDARGASATYSYDALNRLKTLLYSDESLAFTYDDTTTSPNSKGRLSTVTDGSGSTTYGYDLQGRVTSKLQVAGSVSSRVTYAYNAQGQLASLVTPSGQTVGYGYTNNQVTSVTVNGINVLTGAKYFPFGDVASWTWGNGQAYQRIYDSDGRIQSVTIAGTVRTYGFDTASRITGLTDTGVAPAVATIGYDNLDRLTSAINGTAYNELFVYDLIGNRTSETVGGVTTALTYGTTSNRLTQIGTQVIGYDNAGNTASDGTFTYGYSQRNRLVQVSQGSSTVATYKHNAFGERVTKTLGGTTTTFVFDEDGHLLGEYGASGSLIQETVWLEDTPIATLRPKTGGVDIDYVWADHLDTPRAVTTSDAANTLLWKWDSEPFGATTPEVQSITYNLRFPGQYFDVETAKHYNYFRDYDPSLGRYLRADPVGLVAGVNLYSYVYSDPLASFDELGLANSGPWPPPPPRKSCPICVTMSLWGGYCKKGDATCAIAMQSAGFQGPYYAEDKSYDVFCLATLGAGAKTGIALANKTLMDKAKEAAAGKAAGSAGARALIWRGLGGAAMLWGSGWTTLAALPAGLDELFKHCECKDK